MKNVLTNYFAAFPTFAIIALLVIFTFGGSLGQIAFAQEGYGKFLHEPAIKVLTTFSTGVAESAPKIIAAVILLVIGLIVGR